MAPDSLLFIGDSLTEWFDWQSRFPSSRVTNLGVSGETVEGLLSRLGRIPSRVDRPDIIFLMTGINNIASGDHDILPSCREAAERLRQLFPSAVLVIQSILPVNLPGTDNAVIRQVNEQLRQTAAELGASYLDVYGLFVDQDGNPRQDYLLDDGVHLTDRGYAAWADAVEAFLKERRAD